MVSWDICMSGSWAYSTFRKAEICCGDQRSWSLASTSARSRGRSASLLALGRRLRRRAACSASAARYPTLPRLRATSRETDEAALRIRLAMERHECSAARPREISSRSSAVSSHRDLVRRRGRTPPLANTYRQIVASLRPRCRAIADMDSPARRRSQISVLSTSVTAGPPIEHLLGSPKRPLSPRWWCIDPLRPPQGFPSFLTPRRPGC
jgi:hypothetical protein